MMPRCLRALNKQMTRPLRNEWNICFASSGQEAFLRLGKEKFDVLVADIRMRCMDGPMLLREASRHYPEMIRILLSEQCDLEIFMDSDCSAHQFLARPCNGDTLRETIERATSLRALLENELLRSVMMRMNTLPTPPTLYMRIREELRRSDFSMQRIGEMINEDIGMTAKLLQLVNSPFFGFTRTIESPAQATALLGINTVQYLLIHAQAFSVQDPSLEQKMEGISSHCMLVASLARNIAKMEGMSQACCSEAYIAGMMHDLGRLIMEVNLTGSWQLIMDEIKRTNLPCWQVEQQQIGVTHAEIGAYLLGLWGLPAPVVEVIAHHHTPSKYNKVDFFALTAVHAADFLVNEQQRIEENLSLDDSYLEKLGLSDHLPGWRKCFERLLEGNE